ncbi:MAG: response regulator, partial [Merismopedia sp. SIO2A8]|nr:response regulator [Merismopedia sp. SIO2A8]
HLDWLIVVIVPESDFIGEIRAAGQHIIVTGMVALAIALIFGIGFLRWVTLPLKRLSSVSQTLADGDFSQRLHLERNDDIGILAQSFNQMADQLEDSFNYLQKQVDERTLHLEVAKQEAEAANQAKSQFLANMSHELRTPLNGILGYAQVLQRDRSIDPKHQRGLHVIRQCGVHLLSLINEVLDLSKIEAQKMELHPHPFAFQTFLQSIADLFKLRAEEKGIRFMYNPDPHLPTAIEGDDQKLRQVLINLLGNAIKFTDHGHVALTVSIQAPNAKRQTPNAKRPIRFQIQDTGPGIAPKDIEAIFKPFQQVGNHPTKQGTGLGLAISHQLVRLMGGTLSLESKVGQGSCFWFELTVQSISDWPTDTVMGDRLSTQEIVGFEGPTQRILVIDDIEENRLFLIDLLTSIGFDVAEAENGQVGLDMLQVFCPDAILMDLVMPVLDGFQTAQMIRYDSKWSAFQHIPIIAISASTLNQGKAQSLEVGCNAFLSKPVDTGELLQLLQTHLHLQWQYASDVSLPQPVPSTLSDRHHAQPSPLRPTHPLSIHPTPSPSPPIPSPTATPPPAPEIESPPQFVLEQLCQCAEIGDISGISDIVAQLNEPYLAPFVAELQSLTAQFQIKKIQAFLSNFSGRNR